MFANARINLALASYVVLNLYYCYCNPIMFYYVVGFITFNELISDPQWRGKAKNLTKGVMDCKYLLSEFYLIACEKQLSIMQAYEVHPSKAYAYLNAILNATWRLPMSKFNREYRRIITYDEHKYHSVNTGLDAEEKRLLEEKLNNMETARLKAILKEPKTVRNIYKIYKNIKTYKGTSDITGLKIKEVKEIIKRIHARARYEYYNAGRN